MSATQDPRIQQPDKMLVAMETPRSTTNQMKLESLETEEPPKKWSLNALKDRAFDAYCKFIARHPFIMMLCVLAFVISMLMAYVGSGRGLENTYGIFFPLNKVRVKRWFAAQKTFREFSTAERPPLISTRDELTMTVYFSSKNAKDNILTPASLLEIYDMQKALMGVDDFDNWCQHDYLVQSRTPLVYQTPSEGCRRTKSVLNDIVFHGVTYTREDVVALNQSFIDQQVVTYMQPEWLTQGHDFFMTKEFDLDSNHLESWSTRSIMYFGVPLNLTDAQGKRKYMFVNDDNQDDQFDDHESFVKGYSDVFEDLNANSLLIHMNYNEEILLNYEMYTIVMNDMILAMLAMVAVFVLIAVQTQSLFCAIGGMLNVIFSLPVALTFFHDVIGIEIFSMINILAIYVILGIGADNIFVYTDAWKQSQHEGNMAGNLVRRVTWVWRRASVAMFITTFTTFFAFLMTAVSTIPAISTFGIFAALVVLFNYLFVISWYPAWLVVWNMYFEHQCCFQKRKDTVKCVYVPEDQEEEEDPEKEEEEKNEQSVKKHVRQISYSVSRSLNPSEKRRRLSATRVEEEPDMSAYRWMERMFFKSASALHKVRYFLLTGFFVVMIVGAVFAFQLDAPDKEEFSAPSDSQTHITRELNKRYPPSGAAADGTRELTVLWGVNPKNPIDRSGLDQNDEDRLGQLVLDPAPLFQLTNASLDWLEEFSNVIKTWKTAGGTNIVNNNVVRCFVPDFRAYEQTLGSLDSLDYSPQPLAQRLHDFLWFVEDDKFVNYHWKYFIGGVEDINPERTEWVKITVDTTMSESISNSEGETHRDAWDDVLAVYSNTAPEGMRRGFHSCITWVLIEMKAALKSNTIFSVIISFLVASMALLFTTANVFIAGLASLSLGGVVLSLLGGLVIFGFKLGVMESIITTVLVGLAVDYTVHMANSYNEALLTTRFLRARAAMLEIGISITWGAITTLSASFVLMFTVLEFFQLFGTFLFTVVVLSLAWSFLFFVPAVMVFGPRHKPIGDVSHLWGIAKVWAMKKKKEWSKKPTAVTPQPPLREIELESAANQGTRETEVASENSVEEL